MIITKTIEVTSPACDLCEKPTSRKKWNPSFQYLVCKKHEWAEDFFTLVIKHKKQFKNDLSPLKDMLAYLKDKGITTN